MIEHKANEQDNDIYFGQVATRWDTPVRVRRAGKIAESIRQALPQAIYPTALEFGCGTGLVGLQLTDIAQHLWLTDAEPAMLDVVRSKLALQPHPNVSLAQFALAGTANQGAPCDLLFLSMALHHVADVRQAANCFWRTLNPGGCLCVVDLNPEDGHFHDDHPGFQGYNGFEQTELRAILEQEGFTSVQSKTFLWDTKVIEGAAHPFSLFVMTGQKPPAAQ